MLRGRVGIRYYPSDLAFAAKRRQNVAHGAAVGRARDRPSPNGAKAGF